MIVSGWLLPNKLLPFVDAPRSPRSLRYDGEPPAGTPYLEGLLDWEANRRTALLEKAARLSPRVQHVRLESFESQVRMRMLGARGA